MQRSAGVLVIPIAPWREESTPQTFGNVLWSDWIPRAARDGNDCGLQRPCLANDISTQESVVGQFDVEAALRRHLAIPPCGIAATASN